MDYTRTEIIMDEVQRRLEERRLQNTADNRFAILTEIRDEWNKDECSIVDYSMYVLTINLLIGNEKMHLMYRPVKV